MVKLEYSVEKPLNREPDLDKLVSSFLTHDGYDRNHGPIPHLDASTHKISILGLVNQNLSLSIADLQSLPQKSIICALQCAGNRRHTMRTKLHEVAGLDWFDGAVMNCEWRGPLLIDVLDGAGVKVEKEKWKDAHVAFSCFQTPTQEDEWYGASIPLSRAMDPDRGVLLALEMNGEPLPPKHGAPVRVVTPGVAGARSVKWLDRISVQMAESNNHYQQRDYKILPPEAENAEQAEEWWDKVSALQDMPINSVIAVPSADSIVHLDEDGTIMVKGYALPTGADGPIVGVEISVDEGESWQDATLMGNDGKDTVELRWAWTLWSVKARIPKGQGRQIWSRATDKKGNVQQETVEWNLRGVAYNGYGEAGGLEIV